MSPLKTAPGGWNFAEQKNAQNQTGKQGHQEELKAPPPSLSLLAAELTLRSSRRFKVKAAEGP